MRIRFSTGVFRRKPGALLEVSRPEDTPVRNGEASQDRSPQAPSRLNSWKEIAAYLEVSERTAQKWESDKELPVRRLPGPRGRVHAVCAELDRWKNQSGAGRPWHEDVRVLRFVAAVSAGLALLLFGFQLGTWFGKARHGPPAGARVELNTLTVVDDLGAEVWHKSFTDPVLPREYEGEGAGGKVIFADVDPSDPGAETLFVYCPVTRAAKGMKLFCYSAVGVEKWSLTPGRAVSDRRQTYSAAYFIDRLRVASLGQDGKKQVLVISPHAAGSPCQFVVLDAATGVRDGEYWHSGPWTEMDIADVDGDGFREIVLGGVDAGDGTGALAVLDYRNVNGVSQQGSGDPLEVPGLPPAAEDAYILFPGAGIGGNQGDNYVSSLEAGPSRIQACVCLAQGDPDAVVTYWLTDNLGKVDLRISPRLKDLFRTRTGKAADGQANLDKATTELKNLRILRPATTSARR